MPSNPKTTHDRYVATERYVRDVLRIMGQLDDADDPRLVGRVASKILQAMPAWTEDAAMRVETCPKCGARGAAFICNTPGCPVNGGPAYG